MNDKEYLVGSKLLGLENEIDTDYFVFDETKNDFVLKTNTETHIDYFYGSTNALIQYFNFEKSYNADNHAVRIYSILYQYDADIIGQDFPLTYHILEHKQDYIEFLKYLSTNNLSIFNVMCKNRQINTITCHKNTYHIAYLTYIFKNNSTTLTSEQRNKIQLIHDKQMPISYLDELKAEINALQ